MDFYIQLKGTRPDLWISQFSAADSPQVDQKPGLTLSDKSTTTPKQGEQNCLINSSTAGPTQREHKGGGLSKSSLICLSQLAESVGQGALHLGGLLVAGR